MNFIEQNLGVLSANILLNIVSTLVYYVSLASYTHPIKCVSAKLAIF